MSITYAQKNKNTVQTKRESSVSIIDSSSQSESLQRKADMANNAIQRAEAPRPNNTGMPDNLKSGIESLSGFSMDDVRVHYNSSKPATVQALAYTQGTDIHVAPGQEKHLPHEAWHVAQQMAGRVSPTTNINGMPVNDNAALEHEADVMGEKAVGKDSFKSMERKENIPLKTPVFQRVKYDVKHQLILSPQEGKKENLKNDLTDAANAHSGYLRNIVKCLRDFSKKTDIKEKIENENKDTIFNFFATLDINSYKIWYDKNHEEYFSSYSSVPNLVKDLFFKYLNEKKINLNDKDQEIFNRFFVFESASDAFHKDIDSIEDITHLPHLANVGAGSRKRQIGFIQKINESFGYSTNLMGGHLIKCAWGGEDNVMNVVAWYENRAEKIWSREFEDVIDGAFLFDKASKAKITVTAKKESKWSASEEGKNVIKEEDKKIYVDNTTGKYHISKLKKIQIDDAMENIPYSVVGKAVIYAKDGREIEINVEISRDDIGYSIVPKLMNLSEWNKNDETRKKNRILKLMEIYSSKNSIEKQQFEDFLQTKELKIEDLSEKLIARSVKIEMKRLLNKTATPEQMEQLQETVKANCIIKAKTTKVQEALFKANPSIIGEIWNAYVSGEAKEIETSEKISRQLNRQAFETKRKEKRMNAVFEECLNLGIAPTSVPENANGILIDDIDETKYIDFSKTRISSLCELILNHLNSALEVMEKAKNKQEELQKISDYLVIIYQNKDDIKKEISSFQQKAAVLKECKSCSQLYKDILNYAFKYKLGYEFKNI